jgi:Tol biopolymer transport system component
LTAGPGDSTDASFSLDGRWVVYGNDGETQVADVFIRPMGARLEDLGRLAVR